MFWVGFNDATRSGCITDLTNGDVAVEIETMQEIWDLVVAIAQVTGAAIIPVGRPPLVVDALRIRDLPEEVQGLVTVVTSGPELMIALGVVEDPSNDA